MPQITNHGTEETDNEVSAAVLSTMQAVTVEFVKHVGKVKGIAESVVKEAGGRVYTFGSYRLGVFGPGQRNSERCWKSRRADTTNRL